MRSFLLNKKYALILAFLLAAVIANSAYLLKDKNDLEPAIVARVIDGDTIELDDGRMVRLLNINSPEKSSPLHKESLNFLKQYENKGIYLENEGVDKYKRTLGRIYSENIYLNLYLVKNGLASKFLVSESELSEFSDAESYAISNEKGIWEHSDYYKCISAEIKPIDEIIIIKSDCEEINIAGWILKDESRKEYKFNITISDNLILHSRQGNDNQTDLFWNSKTDIWNNDRDTLYIFDNENKIVLAEPYGY